MDGMDAAAEGGVDGVFDSGLGERFLEEMVQVAAEDGLEQFLFLQPGDKIQRRLVGPL